MGLRRDKQAANALRGLWDAADGGQIFISQATASLLDLGALWRRDLGMQQTRRTRQTVHVYELVVPVGR